MADSVIVAAECSREEDRTSLLESEHALDSVSDGLSRDAHAYSPVHVLIVDTSLDLRLENVSSIRLHSIVVTCT